VDVQPVIAVSYSSSPAALNLDSLRINVNGSDWTSRFDRGANSASYTVAGADTLVAGSLTIEASIADETGASMSATADYSVLPTLQALDPTRGPIGSAVQVTALGLDPSPSNNLLVFRAVAGGELSSPFSSVLSGTNRGIAPIPANADTGPVFLVVNGQRSLESVAFQVASPFPNCGNAVQMSFMSDGSLLVFYWFYFAYQGTPYPAHPSCPVVPSLGVREARSTIVREHPGGGIDLIMDLPRFTFLGTANAVGLAVDKRGEGMAILTLANLPTGDDYLFRVYHSTTGSPSFTVTSFLGKYYAGTPGNFSVTGPLAFDAAGNLYIATFDLRPPEHPLQILKIPASVLSTGGPTTPIVAATSLNLPSWTCPSSWTSACGQVLDLNVTCDGRALVGTAPTLSAVSTTVREVDLKSGSVIGDLTLPDVFARSTLTCRPEELLLGTQTDGVQIARSTALANPELLSTVPGLTSWVPGEPSAFAVSREGVVYLAPIDLPWAPRQFMVPAPSLVEQCGLGGTLFTAQPFPCSAPDAAIQVLPSTTRWKPQRDTTKNIEIKFSSATPLKSAKITITGPSAVAPIQATFDPANPPNPYVATWTGPWITTDPSGSAAYLNRGDYTVKIEGVTLDDTPVASSDTGPNATVSLVEVSKVELCQADGTDDCLPLATPYPDVSADNPAVAALPGQDPPQERLGGGKRIFAEARTPTGAIKNTVKVRATIDPKIPSGAGSADALTVPVYFKSYDVDDPAPYAPDLDGDDPSKAPSDNRGTPKEGVVLTPMVTINPGASTGWTLFQTSSQPGDNYRVAASTSQQWLGDLQPAQPSATGEIPVPDEAKGTVSEMLTV